MNIDFRSVTGQIDAGQSGSDLGIRHGRAAAAADNRFVSDCIPMTSARPRPLSVDPRSAHLLVVVGAPLEAEVEDRPIARRLVERLEADGIRALTCTDLWYLNRPELMTGRTIAIGRPDVNAATATIATRVPAALVVDGQVRIHVDVEGIDRQACAWGRDAAATAHAVDVFCERYLEGFVGGE